MVQRAWCSVVVFRHEAERLEQEARGRLERQKISDEAEAERARKELLLLQANSAAVESTGQAKAEAQSRAEASKIEGEAAVEQAKLKAQAMKIEAVSAPFSAILAPASAPWLSGACSLIKFKYLCWMMHLVNQVILWIKNKKIF